MLEKQLAKVTKKLEFSDSKIWLDKAKEVDELYDQARKTRNEKVLGELEIKIRKATIQRDKAAKASMAATGKISEWVDEQFAIEEEIKLLKIFLGFSEKDLQLILRRYESTFS